MLGLFYLLYPFLIAPFPCSGAALDIARAPTSHVPVSSPGSSTTSTVISVSTPSTPISVSTPSTPISDSTSSTSVSISTTSTPISVSTSSTLSVPASSPTCIVNDNSAATTINMSFVETDPSTGKLLTIYVGQVISKPGASTPVKSSLSLNVYLDSEELFTNNGVIFQNSTAGGAIHWGALAENPHTVSFTVGTNNVTTGVIDGKLFSPLYVGHNTSTPGLWPNTSTPGFWPNTSTPGLLPITSTPRLERREELKPLLQITPSPAFNISVESLQASIAKGMQGCHSELNSYYVPSNVSRHSIILPRDDRTQDLGHFSDTYDAGSCVRCEALATAGVGTAEAICIAATCWWSFGVGCAACYAAAATGEFFALAGCNFSGACCPITCGSGSYPVNPPDCCFGQETCLSPGLCCSQGQRTCAGKACCNSDQSCISQGLQQGTCCPTDSICGQTCCPSSTDVCMDNSVCCDPSDVCGGIDGVCCNPIDPLNTGPSLLLNYCADASRRLCCLSGNVAVDGICCQSGAINCNGKCCHGTCNPNGTCTNPITDAECQAMGSLGACSTTPSCQPGGWDICMDDGCCEEAPK